MTNEVRPHLSPELLARGLALAETMTLYGERLSDLSRDELLAAAVLGWDAYNRHLDESIRRFPK